GSQGCRGQRGEGANRAGQGVPAGEAGRPSARDGGRAGRGRGPEFAHGSEGPLETGGRLPDPRVGPGPPRERAGDPRAMAERLPAAGVRVASDDSKGIYDEVVRRGLPLTREQKKKEEVSFWPLRGKKE